MSKVVNLEVKLRKGESSSSLIKRFCKQTKKFGYDNENFNRYLKDSSAMSRRFKKPSDVKREKKKERKKVIERLKAEREYNG